MKSEGKTQNFFLILEQVIHTVTTVPYRAQTESIITLNKL